MLRRCFGRHFSKCRVRLVLVTIALFALAASADAQLIFPGSDLATVETENLRVHLPIDHAERLEPLVARAEQIYAHMIRDAGYTPRKKLDVLFGDWVDFHNGFSFVTPFPVVQVELAPALAESSIFSGFADTERTLVHEFAHHISNDRTHGFRKGLERVFGRILPNDILSLILFYLSTPAHQTMPAFWHEGLATWAETQYADPESVWGGRGRDALTHMIWRLDAAGDAIPEVGDWRLTHHEWPYGRTVYTYGVAYLRYLQARFGGRFSVWELIREQSHTWPYLFNRGPRKTLGIRHRPMIEGARRSLEFEQLANITALSEVPFTALTRLTPEGMVVGAPAWLSGGRLAFSTYDPYGKPRIRILPDAQTLQASGVGLHKTGLPSYALSNLRSDGVEQLIYHEYNWRQFARAHVGRDVVGERLLQPDSRDGYLVALHLAGGGRQELVIHAGGDNEWGDAAVIATEGQPWTPTLRPGQSDKIELVWVETTREGSRLVLGALDPNDVVGGSEADGSGSVVFACGGRILHPVWSPDGQYVFFCSDLTGVANGYRLNVDTKGVVPVTHTLGGVIACVPSPDGSQLALVDHDRSGPFIAKIPNDPEAWPQAVPRISLTWPGAVFTDEMPTFPDLRRRRNEGPLPLPTEIPDVDPDNPVATETSRYWGSLNTRPRFWMPTTAAAPYGGVGVIGFASDPLLTNLLTVGIGAGPVEAEPVGIISYTKLSHELEWGLEYTRDEKTYYDEIVTTGLREFDYTETVDAAKFRLGRGIAAPGRRFRAYGTVGVADYRAEHSSKREWRNFALRSVPAFDGTEAFLEFSAGYGNTTFFPTSYAPEDGIDFLATYRHSGLGADLKRNLAFFDAGYVLSVWPEMGQQLVLGGKLGWSDGDRTLQGSYTIGGSFQTAIPRGYFGDTESIGQHLLAYSVAYRAALWRPFDGYGTTPFRHRQVFVEAYFDAAKVSREAPGDDGRWFRSVGGQLHTSWEVFGLLLQPGIGVAHQLDGDYHTQGYFVLGVGL